MDVTGTGDNFGIRKLRSTLSTNEPQCRLKRSFEVFGIGGYTEPVVGHYRAIEKDFISPLMFSHLKRRGWTGLWDVVFVLYMS
jgi:hypothetical protein